MTPSGVPPMPIMTSTGAPALATSMAPPTSPSEMRRMRAPASRHWRTRSACRGRSSISTVTSLMGLSRARATASRFWATLLFRLTVWAGTWGPTASFSMYITGPGSNREPRLASAMTETAPLRPCAVRVVPSRGSTAMSTGMELPSPMRSPQYSMGASSFSPSPITTTPSICTLFSTFRIMSTAALSAAFLSPLPSHRPLASAAASVTRTSSKARLR
mmetsp:Transcript_11190/g.24092  ORF Transcript_11190/g.24092 Transcript_11190/m.24092 type:complete len:217 (+) Transcript_11190:2324-2974(+)